MAGMGDHGGMGDEMNDGVMSMPPQEEQDDDAHDVLPGEDVEILFSGWLGHSLSMHVLTLLFVFVLSVTVEWLSGSRLIRPGTNRVSARLAQTGLHALRIGLAYMVMLAVTLFNAGVIIVAVAGHPIGFLLFGSRVFKPAESRSRVKST